jgi:hypothetical protein
MADDCERQSRERRGRGERVAAPEREGREESGGGGA